MLKIRKKGHLREFQIGCATLVKEEIFLGAEVENAKMRWRRLLLHRTSFTCFLKLAFDDVLFQRRWTCAWVGLSSSCGSPPPRSPRLDDQPRLMWSLSRAGLTASLTSNMISRGGGIPCYIYLFIWCITESYMFKLLVGLEHHQNRIQSPGKRDGVHKHNSYKTPPA